jgi:hypothetical protein
MRSRSRTPVLVIAGTVVVLATPGVAVAGGESGRPATLLATGLAGGSGSTIGPDGDLYVTEPVGHQVSRIDLDTGDRTVVADCLPSQAFEGVAGAMDVAFLEGSMYVLTAVVSEDVGGTGVTGVYRVEEGDCEVVADIGRWNIDNPPPPDLDFFVTSGLPYAMQRYHGGFLVTDGHLNRVLHVTLDGAIHEVLQLPNVVPTGLDRHDDRVWLALAGPVPHLPEDGQVVSFTVERPEPRLVASGGRLLVDVEFAGDGSLYALAQGVFPEGAEPGAPALPDTGRLLRADDDEFDVVARELDRPTSLEITGGKAYVVTLDGEVWWVDLSHHDD